MLPGGTYVTPWSDAVDATMVETIIAPSFGSTNVDPFTVQVMKNNRNGKYRIIAPWSKTYAALGAPEGTVVPDLDIDASDPTNLVVAMQSIGIYGGDEAGTYYVMSMSYYNDGNDAETEDAAKITLKDNGDGTSTISFPYRSMMLYAGNSKKFYYACNDATNLSYITFPTFSGINNITADDNKVNAPVEYYNLQGMRIAAPVEGQLVIKRQGSEVEKLIVR